MHVARYFYPTALKRKYGVLKLMKYRFFDSYFLSTSRYQIILTYGECNESVHSLLQLWMIYAIDDFRQL